MIIQENTIIHGDSLTVLRQMEPESVDAIITDPPYGINYVSQTGASIKNDKSPFIWFLYDAFRVLKSGEAGRGGLICFTRWDVEQTFIDAMKIAGFNVKSEVIWDKVFPVLVEYIPLIFTFPSFKRAAAIAFVKAFLRCSKKRSFFHITKLQALSEQ